MGVKSMSWFTSSDWLPVWLGFILVILGIVLIVQIIGLRRVSKRQGTEQVGGPAHIDLKNKEIARKLGDESASETGKDPRGTDIGGDFREVTQRPQPSEVHRMMTGEEDKKKSR